MYKKALVSTAQLGRTGGNIAIKSAGVFGVRFLYFFVFGFSLILYSVPATAQSSNTHQQQEALPEALSSEFISDLTSRLEPEQVEALARLIELLARDAPADPDLEETTEQPTSLLQSFSNFAAYLASNILLFPQMVLEVVPLLAGVLIGLGGSGVAKLIGLLVVSIGAGILAEILFKKSLPRRWDIQEVADSNQLLVVLRVLGLRLACNVVGLSVFAIVTLAIVRVSGFEMAVTTLASAFVLQVIMFPRIAALFLRFFLSPKRAEQRLVTADSMTAARVMKDLVLVSAIIGIALFLFSQLADAQPHIATSFRFWFAACVIGLIVFLAWRNRAGLTGIIQGDDELTPGLERMAAWWPGVSIIFIVLDWLTLQFLMSNGQEISPMKGALTIVLILVLPFLDTALRGLVRHLQQPLSITGDVAQTAQEETRMSLVRSGRVILIVLALIGIGKIWGISLQDVAQAGFGAQFGAGIFGLLLTLAVGYVAWEIVNLWIYRRMLTEVPASMGEEAEVGGEGGGAALSRMATILPLVRITLQVAIIALTVLLAASQLGINIAPLLAGAGVVGLAIGFGAQTLVKDVVSGVFFLLDDSFRVGEFINVGGTVGSVEKISVRSLQLRHPSGAVHIIPYGEIPKITNNSRDWVIVKMKFIVPFDTDLNKTRKLFKKIGQQMYDENPYYAENILEPFKFQGVHDVDDVGITVRGKFMAKPGSQFLIRKDVYSRVQKAFEENGIEFARREVRVKIPEGEDAAALSEAQKTTIATAASEVVQNAQKKPTETEGP